MRTFIVWLLLCASTLALTASAQLTDDPLLLQRQGIARVDAYIDHMRKTGDRVTRCPELARAEQELAPALARVSWAPGPTGRMALDDRPATRAGRRARGRRRAFSDRALAHKGTVQR